MKAPGYVPNSAQRRLAEEVTRFVHGEEGLQQAIKATEVGGWVMQQVDCSSLWYVGTTACSGVLSRQIEVSGSVISAVFQKEDMLPAHACAWFGCRHCGRVLPPRLTQRPWRQWLVMLPLPPCPGTRWRGSHWQSSWSQPSCSQARALPASRWLHAVAAGGCQHVRCGLSRCVGRRVSI
jgi:hypothetical protein